METVSKAGMMVNAGGEVIGWVAAGSDMEMQEGDVVISHHKTADKAGLLEQFNSLKAENQPAKAKKEVVEGAEDKAPRTRVDVPKTGSYTVVKAGYANNHANPDCAAVYKLLTDNTDFAVFFENAKPYTHIKRDGSEGAMVAPNAVVAYAIRRGVITVD